MTGARGHRPFVLALRALGLGDLLTALPALRALRRAHPDAHLALASPEGLAPLALATGAVDTVLPARELEPVDLGPARALGRPDLAVNLHGQGPESHRLLLALRPGRLVAFAHAEVPACEGGARWREDEHEAVRWCRLLEWHGMEADPSELDLDTSRWEEESISERPGTRCGPRPTVIHAGAAFPARRWPARRWSEVARHEIESGREVLLTGSAEEEGLAAEVARVAGLGPESVLAGRTGIVELARVVAGASCVLCADTGVAHLATATRTPSVVLFGPTSPLRWGPPDRPYHRVLWNGRTGDPWASRPDPGLMAITVDDVVAAREELEGATAVTG